MSEPTFTGSITYSHADDTVTVKREYLESLHKQSDLLEVVCRKAADRFGPAEWGSFVKEVRVDQKS